jgi:AraC-like DNA-binding protein
VGIENRSSWEETLSGETLATSRYPFTVLRTSGNCNSLGVRCSVVGLDEAATKFLTVAKSLRFWIHVSGSSIISLDNFKTSYTLYPDAVVMGLPGSKFTSSWRGRSEVLLLEFDSELAQDLWPSFRSLSTEAEDDGFRLVEDSCLAHGLKALNYGVLSSAGTDVELTSHLKAAVLGRTQQLLLSQCNTRPTVLDSQFSDALDLQRFIFENLDSRLHISDFAGARSLNIRKLSGKYRRLTGYSPYQHLLQLRVQRAQDLLGDKKIAISEVALSLGFYDQSQFAKIFKKIRGLTPKAYREQVCAQEGFASEGDIARR